MRVDKIHINRIKQINYFLCHEVKLKISSVYVSLLATRFILRIIIDITIRNLRKSFTLLAHKHMDFFIMKSRPNLT